MDKFDEGVLFSAAEITRGHGADVYQEDLIIAAGLQNADCSMLAEFDQEALKKLNNYSNRLSLTF